MGRLRDRPLTEEEFSERMSPLILRDVAAKTEEFREHLLDASIDNAERRGSECVTEVDVQEAFDYLTKRRISSIIRRIVGYFLIALGTAVAPLVIASPGAMSGWVVAVVVALCAGVFLAGVYVREGMGD